MELTITQRGILQIDGAKIIHRNFKGEGNMYNREGDRNFSLLIPDENIAIKLQEEGWNVKIKPPREEGDTPFIYLPVKVKFTKRDTEEERGPAVYLISGNARNKLDSSTIATLDNIDILSVDLDIRPYDWEIGGKVGRTAYLQAMNVVQNIDRFSARYQEI